MIQHDIDETEQQFNQIYMNIFLRILAPTRTAMKTNFLSNMLATQKPTQESVKKWRKKWSFRSHVCQQVIRSELSKGEKSYQANLDHSYKIRKNFWSYCKEIFESEPAVQPSFDRPTCFSYFKDSLARKNKTRNFELPSWIVSMEPPSVEFDLSLIQ